MNKLVYILASNYTIAHEIYRKFYPTGRIVDLRYVRGIETIMGVRGVKVIISDEKYPDSSFYDRMSMLLYQQKSGRVKLVYEQDILEGLND